MTRQGAASVKKSLHSVIDKEWFFWSNYGGSFMGPGKTNPILTMGTDGEQSKFRLIRLPETLDTPGSNGDTVQVAIEHATTKGKKRYISCRRRCAVTNSCLAEYRERVGEFETFTMSYCEVDNSFIFQSHNHYFLHFNETFHTVAFKTCSGREDGFPLKGRWDLLGGNEINRIGTKSAATRIPSQILKSPFKVVGGLVGIEF
mmetsp:Transcript_60241/g.178497  ORF Transcript_60241/g.178497 Transcript_60241/m.178497 type:complete len:202 (-) Transcript_60241:144-749(-)